MADDETYTWVGQAADEAHAVVFAKPAASDDGWAPNGPVGYRVVESAGFLPCRARVGRPRLLSVR
jgi:hypothetical protein